MDMIPPSARKKEDAAGAGPWPAMVPTLASSIFLTSGVSYPWAAGGPLNNPSIFVSKVEMIRVRRTVNLSAHSWSMVISLPDSTPFCMRKSLRTSSSALKLRCLDPRMWETRCSWDDLQSITNIGLSHDSSLSSSCCVVICGVLGNLLLTHEVTRCWKKPGLTEDSQVVFVMN